MTADRLPPLPESQWSDRQHDEVRQVIDGPRGALISPFVPLMRSPELMGHAQRMGEYLRYRSAIGLRLSELAIHGVIDLIAINGYYTFLSMVMNGARTEVPPPARSRSRRCRAEAHPVPRARCRRPPNPPSRRHTAAAGWLHCRAAVGWVHEQDLPALGDAVCRMAPRCGAPA